MAEGRSYAWRLVAEFLVIVVGVLVALAVDRWTESQDTRALERSYLEALRSDFVANREVSGERSAVHRESAVLGSLVLVSISDDPLQAVSYDSLASAIELTGWNRARRFIDNTWLDLISTGNLGLLDADLRQRLRAFYSFVEHLEERDAEHLTYILAYRSAVGAVLPSMHRLELADAVFDRRNPDVAGSVSSLRSRLRGVPGVSARIADVVMAHRGGESTQVGLLDQIEEILAAVDEALAAV